MPKPNVGAILKQHLGKEVADAMTAKIDKMIADKKSAAQIEKAIQDDLVAHLEKEVTAAVIVKVGPATPIKVKPIQTDVKSKIAPISVSFKVGPPIKVTVEPPVAVGPGPMGRGKK